MSNHTAGPWRANGTHLLGSIVADVPTGETNIDKPDHVEAYQGYLIAESVLPQNRAIIAAAPEMLAMLKKNAAFIHDQFGTSEDLLELEALIAKAEGRAC